jgi:phage terminase large subunit
MNAATAPAVHEGARRSYPPGKYRVVYRDGDGEERVIYDPQPKQDLLHGCTAPNILYGGRAGGGKSHAARWDGIVKGLRIPGLRVLMLRRNLTDLQKTHLLELPVELPLRSRENPHGMATWNEQKKQLWLHHPRGPNGEQRDALIQFGHCEDEKALGGYLSSQWDIVILDEGSLFTPRMLRWIRMRLRTKNPRVRRVQFIICTNPGGDGHLWLKQRFIDHAVPEGESRNYDPAEWEYIPSALEDNAYIDEEQYEKQFSEMTDAEYKAYRLGDWDTFAGQYFTEWSRAVHVITAELQEEIPEWWEVAAGMDWGYSPSPGWVGWVAFDEHGRALAYKELLFDEMTAGEVARAIGDRCVTEMERRMTIYGDTSMWTPQSEKHGKSIADEINEELARMGLEVTLMKANKDRLNGWHRVHQFLKPVRPQPDTDDGTLGPWIRFYDVNEETGNGLPYLIATIGVQMHDEVKLNGDMKKGATDHGCDGLRYLLIEQEPLPAIPRHVRPGTAHHTRVHNVNRRRVLRELQRQNEEHLEGAQALEEEALHLFGPEGDDVDEDDGETRDNINDLWN